VEKAAFLRENLRHLRIGSAGGGVYVPRTFIVVGLGFGDEGKGSIVDHLVRRHGIRHVARFNGGAQARHHVVHNGVVHGFSQFGSGTLAGAETILSRFMLFEPLAFCREAHTLSNLGVPDPYAMVTLSERAPIITPPNILANRILELDRGAGRHGSCGLGIGLTQEDVEVCGEEAIYAGDLRKVDSLREKLRSVLQRRLETVAGIDSHETKDLRNQLAATDLDDLAAFYSEFADRIRIVSDEQIMEKLRTNGVVFEGAQGVLLDQQKGFFPYVTRSTTTYENAGQLLDDADFSGERLRVGLLRAYATRHGAGPLPTETAEMRVEPCHNAENPWQGEFRTGWFDGVTARYALDVVGGVDILGITNVDRLTQIPDLKAACAYGPDSSFPGGRIPIVNSDLDVLRARTVALAEVVPQYAALPAISSHSCVDSLKYGEALGEMIGRRIDLISASTDAQKIYRVSESRL
jgi:adenylosuccinate synthase